MGRFWAIGVDFGGTNIKCGLVNPHGRVVRSRVLLTKAVGRPGPFVEAIAATAQELAQAGGVAAHSLAGIGVGAPGLVDTGRGVVHRLTNVPGWREVPLAARLARASRSRVVVENDANAFTLGEWRLGAGRGASHLIGMTLGTGVGGGVICNGALYRGATGAAGEIGHVMVDPRGPTCGCGARGCLEAFVGARAISRLGRRWMRRSAVTPALISQAARAGDARAKAVWREIGRRLGIGLASVVNLLEPQRVVIGGGVAQAWRWFAPTSLQTMRRSALEGAGRRVRVVRGRLGAHAGILGAAVLVWDNEVLGERCEVRGTK